MLEQLACPGALLERLDARRNLVVGLVHADKLVVEPRAPVDDGRRMGGGRAGQHWGRRRTLTTDEAPLREKQETGNDDGDDGPKSRASRLDNDAAP